MYLLTSPELRIGLQCFHNVKLKHANFYSRAQGDKYLEILYSFVVMPIIIT